MSSGTHHPSYGGLGGVPDSSDQLEAGGVARARACLLSAGVAAGGRAGLHSDEEVTMQLAQYDTGDAGLWLGLRNHRQRVVSFDGLPAQILRTRFTNA